MEEKYMDNYAHMENRNLWLRHPVLGDPSFDTFERVGEPVHRSRPPYEWAVNGSLFRDPKDGAWYYYAGLYPYGYATREDCPSHFVIYRSVNEGESWECLGPGFEKGFTFDHLNVASDHFPDVVVIYDEESDKYWMTYDWASNNTTWENAHCPRGTGSDSGSALAWARSPAGPFTRLSVPYLSNARLSGALGRFARMYGATVLKRKKDWISFILCDSNQHFSWGLACMTAPSPEGPWSDPFMLLSVDRPEYYPSPVEFFPCFAADDRVYAPATSVAATRNYQAVFSAKLEDAHQPGSWNLEFDGDAWHSRPVPEETCGIWGQTFNGFVHNGKLTVMYPSKDDRDYGILSVASRPWNMPFSDGFTFSGHGGPSISPTLAAYDDFSLTADLKRTGIIDIAFNYSGILGPNRSCADSVPHRQALSGYSALRLDADGSKLITVDCDGNETIHLECGCPLDQGKIKIERRKDQVTVWINDKRLGNAGIPCDKALPLALIAQKASMLICESFEVEGERKDYTLFYNSHDALLGAGQKLDHWESAESPIYAAGEGFTGEGTVKAKWNVIGNHIEVYAPKAPYLGVMSVWVDGYFSGTANLTASEEIPSAPIYIIENLKQGRHSVLIMPETGKITVDMLAVHGTSPV